MKQTLCGYSVSAMTTAPKLSFLTYTWHRYSERKKKRSKVCCYQNNVHPILLYRKITVSTGALKKGQRIKNLIKIQLSKMFSIRLPNKQTTHTDYEA